MRKTTREEALQYHSRGRKGKIEVVATKPCRTQEDLSLAYTPGVAEPCLDIAADPEKVYDYTAKGNLVAVISNGTAVLGLGDIGPLAAKPVMEGKGVLFKRFADIDVFDIEVDEKDADRLIETVAAIAPTFGGINLEDIKSPECFVVEEALKKRLQIPVFHDDQHGTAIISAAALLNALEIVGKAIGDVKVVFVGAGAAAIACAKLYLSYGVRKENLRLVDKTGVIYAGRGEMNPYKAQFAVATSERSLADALVGADVFVGLSTKGIVTGEMLKAMARDPIVFALANPDPEITPEEAKAARPDVIMATGRSDYPNQVNNVLGFPFIFRGALDVRAREINEPMKMAASRALAALARMDVPDSVSKAYGGQTFRFGREYLIPKPFDFRVLLWVAPAVAEAAMASGVARQPIGDMAAYLRRLEAMLSRSREVMSVVIEKARQDPRRIVFAEGEHPRVLRAAKILAEEGICRPILLARDEEAVNAARDLHLPMDKVEMVLTETSAKLPIYAKRLEELRRRDGVTAEAAARLVRIRNYYAPLMLDAGDADGVISGLTQSYPDTIRPALQIVGTAPGVRRVSGLYILMLKDNRTFFFADTTVNIDPTAEELAEIALLTADAVRRFDIEPRLALISFSNFGSNTHASALKVKRAAELIRAARPSLPVDGEMQADFAVVPEMLEENYPWAAVRDPNILIFANLEAANAAYKLVWRLAGAEAIGPILLGMRKPVHVLQRGIDVADIVNMAAIAVVDAQEKARHSS